MTRATLPTLLAVVALLGCDDGSVPADAATDAASAIDAAGPDGAMPGDAAAPDAAAPDAAMADAGAAPAPSRIYVTLVSHNEDTATGMNPACTAFFGALDARWDANRAATLAIADAVEARGAAWDLQTDVEYLNAVIAREGEADNVLRQLASRPSGRIAIDAHAHEARMKNYADVANLVERVSGVRNGVVGGFTSEACRPMDVPPDWEKFRAPLAPVGLGPDFVATVLTLGASPGHRCDPGASGVWRPASHEAFYMDDPGQALPTIGVGLAARGLDATVAAIGQLLDDLRMGRLESNRIYTASVTLPQCDFDLAGGGATPADVEAFIDAVNALDGGDDTIRWATFPQILDLWRTDYGGQPSLWTGAS